MRLSLFSALLALFLVSTGLSNTAPGQHPYYDVYGPSIIEYEPAYRPPRICSPRTGGVCRPRPGFQAPPSGGVQQPPPRVQGRRITALPPLGPPPPLVTTRPLESIPPPPSMDLPPSTASAPGPGTPPADSTGRHCPPPTDLSGIESHLGNIEDVLTAITGKLDNAGTVQDRIADMIQANQAVIAKLDEIIRLFEEGSGRPFEITLTIQSPNGDNSAVYATQRRTGFSHGVLVIDSADPEWERLEPDYIRAGYKLPITKLDVQTSAWIKSSRPRLVLYYMDRGQEPKIVSGDRAVANELRILYSE